MTMNEEALVRQTIENNLADWDNAYAERDTYGYLGHCTPDDTGEQEKVFSFYKQLFTFCDALESESRIQEFTLENGLARVTIQVDQRTTFKKNPGISLPPWRKSLFGWLARFVVVSREVRHLVWIETPEGWLCKSDKAVSERYRVCRKYDSI